MLSFSVQLGAFRPGEDQHFLSGQVLALVEGLAENDARILAEQPRFPPLYESGVRYDSRDIWRDCVRALQVKRGHCATLAAWLVAEYRVSGLSARPVVTFKARPGRGTLYHVLVDGPHGREDPSRRLGMK